MGFSISFFLFFFRIFFVFFLYFWFSSCFQLFLLLAFTRPHLSGWSVGFYRVGRCSWCTFTEFLLRLPSFWARLSFHTAASIGFSSGFYDLGSGFSPPAEPTHIDTGRPRHWYPRLDFVWLSVTCFDCLPHLTLHRVCQRVFIGFYAIATPWTAVELAFDRNGSRFHSVFMVSRVKWSEKKWSFKVNVVFYVTQVTHNSVKKKPVKKQKNTPSGTTVRISGDCRWSIRTCTEFLPSFFLSFFSDWFFLWGSWLTSTAVPLWTSATQKEAGLATVHQTLDDSLFFHFANK